MSEQPAVPSRAGLTQDHYVSDTIRDVMSPRPRALGETATVAEAAEVMRAAGIGDVLVLAGARLVGILTDRDIVVRVLARDLDPGATRIGDVCSRDPETLGPEDSVGRAVRLMRDRAIRRLPIVEHGEVVGILTVGDIAIARDSRTGLADISAAPPNS
jgi:CBS domain-containing protein